MWCVNNVGIWHLGRGLQSPVLAFKALVWTNLSWSVSCDHLNFKEVKYDHWNTPLKLYWKIFGHSKLTQPQQLAAFKVFISCDFVRVTQHIQQTRASVWSCVLTPSLVSTKSWEIRKSGSLATRCLNVFTSLMATLSVCYLMLDRWPNQTKPNQSKPKLAENPMVVGGLFLQAISFTLHSTCPFDPPLNVNDTELVSVFRAFFTSITSGALALSWDFQSAVRL